ncbi:hypothetical protein [Microbacterium binotii]|uniref:HK97 gp10 family phage protein n=1 Tax=Microbacterium binotii TaxID=462710 RepID=A0ABN3P919_9MICO
MKVNVADTEKVQAALDEVQVTRTGKPSTAGVYDASEVRREAEAAEYALEKAGIPVSLRKGATVVAHQRTGTKNWSYGTSVIFLERGKSGWFVTGVVRDRVGDERRVRIYPPTGFDLRMHAQRVLRNAGMVA